MTKEKHNASDLYESPRANVLSLQIGRSIMVISGGDDMDFEMGEEHELD